MEVGQGPNWGYSAKEKKNMGIYYCLNSSVIFFKLIGIHISWTNNFQETRSFARAASFFFLIFCDERETLLNAASNCSICTCSIETLQSHVPLHWPPLSPAPHGCDPLRRIVQLLMPKHCSSCNPTTRLLISEAIRAELLILPPLPAGADNCGDYIGSAYTSILNMCINFLCLSCCLFYTSVLLFVCYIGYVRSGAGMIMYDARKMWKEVLVAFDW
jgi:hypothetical protein